MSGEVISQGRFRVDRRRALDKMEKFQLEDPYRYVLEVLVAARCAKAARVDITNDSDDFIASWQGDAPDRDELEALFDHLFGTPDDDHGRVLQHLALAAIGALALRPRWLRVDRGDAEGAHRIEVTDPTETSARTLAEALSGVRFDLREQFGQATITEALALLFQEPVETRLIRGASRWYPVPIVVNGEPLSRATGPELNLGSWSSAPNDAYAGELWLVPASGSGRIDVLRHGVVVAHHAVTVPRSETSSSRRCEVIGWFECPALRLNASRSAVVQDEAWTGATAAIDCAVGDLLQHLGQGDPDAALVRLAIEELQRRSRPLGALAAEICATDLRGRAWDYAALTRLVPPPGWTAVADLFQRADPPYVVFSADLGPWLEANVKGCQGDVVADLSRRSYGRGREAAAAPAVPRLGEPQRVIDAGSVEGAVRLVALTEPEAAVCTLTVLVRGRVLERTTFPVVGASFVAIATDRELTSDPEFKSADRSSAAWQRILAAINEAMTEELRAVVRQGGPRGQVALGALCATFTTTKHVGRAFAARATEELDAELLAAPVFTTGDGRRLGLGEVMAIEGWFAFDEVPSDCPPILLPRLLLLAPQHRSRFERWLGCAPFEAAHAELERERRLTAPRREARLQPDLGIHHVAVALPGLTGELGFPRRPAGPQTRIEVLRDGVAVETLSVQLPFAGIVGVIDLTGAEVNRAHDTLAPSLVKALPKLLGPTVNELVIGYWLAEGLDALRLDARVQAWVVASGLVDSHHKSLLPCEAAALADGTVLTFADLDERARGKQRVIVLLEPPPAGLPFPNSIVASSKAHLDVLLKWLGKAGSDGTARLATMKAAHAKFLQQPAATQPDALAIRTFAVGDDFEGLALLPSDPANVGQKHVEARWQGRVLGTHKPGPGGAWVAAWGSAILPNDTFDGPRDGDLLRRIGAEASREFAALVDDALAALDGDDPGARRDTWLALACSTKPKQLSEAANARIRSLRVIRRVDGELVSIDAVTRAARAKSPVRRLPASVNPGEAPHPWYVYQPDGIDLTPLLGKLDDGSNEVAEHREALRKLGTMPRRQPTLGDDVLAKVALKIDGLVGEVGLVPGAGQLQIVPLHEGIALAPVTTAFPIGVQVVAAGKLIRPDRSLTRASSSPDWEAARVAIEAAAHAFARATVLAWSGKSDRPAQADVASAYGMSDAGRNLKVLRLGPGGLVSRDDLDALHARDGVIGAVSRRCPTFVAGEPPVLATGALLASLVARYSNVVNLDAIAERHRNEPAAAPPERYAMDVSGYTGQVGLADEGESRIELYNKSVHLTSIPWDRVVPLRGRLGSPGLKPTPDWRGLVDEDRAALERAILRAAERVLHAMIDADPSGSKHHALFERALFECCPDAGALRAATAGTDLSTTGARLARIPLFADARGQRVSLQTLADEEEIRVVRSMAKREVTRRYVRLDELARRRLAGAFRVVDGDEALATEVEGLARKANSRFQRPTWNLFGGAETTVTAPSLKGRLWLAAPDGASNVAVVVDGSRVQALDLGVAGLCGYVEGPFEVDLAFTKATLRPDQLAAVEDAAGGLLAAELAADRDRIAARLARLTAPPTPAWDRVAWFFDQAGEPLTFGAIRALTGERKPVPVALEDERERAQWTRLFPKARPADGDGARAPSKSERDRQRKRMLAVAKRLAPGLDAQVLRNTELLDGAYHDGTPSAVFAAWELVTKVVRTASPETELEILLRVAKELRDVTSARGG